MENKINERERDIRKAKESIMKHDEEIRSFTEEMGNMKIERDTFHEEIERFKV